MANLRTADPFPQPDRVLIFRMKPQKELYGGQQIRILAAEVVRHMSALPGVTSAALAEEGPYGSRGASHATVRTSDGRTIAADMDIVSPGLFATLGIPFLNGRDFSERDNEHSRPVIVVDELLARRLFESDAVGKMVEAPLGGKDVAFEIIGVARASRYYDLHQSLRPMFFYNLQQAGPYMPALHVRLGSASPETVLSEVRREFGVIDRNVPIFDIRTLQDRALDTLAQQRLVSDLAGAFGALALSLVAVGLYGLMAFSVAQRTREIGIRTALGASPPQVMGMVIGQGMKLVLIGVVAGVLGALGATKPLAAILYQVTPNDPRTFLVVVILFAVVSAAACYLPARRAMRVDPMVALRHE
jgi:predicted permease